MNGAEPAGWTYPPREPPERLCPADSSMSDSACQPSGRINFHCLERHPQPQFVILGNRHKIQVENNIPSVPTSFSSRHGSFCARRWGGRGGPAALSKGAPTLFPLTFLQCGVLRHPSPLVRASNYRIRNESAKQTKKPYSPLKGYSGGVGIAKSW